MAENKQYGRVIAVSKVQTVASTDGKSFQKREIYIDCTRYDPYTGVRSEYENKPLLEFSGDKTLAKVNPILETLQKDDVVAISFELQGRQFKGQDGKIKFMTGIRCYNIEVVRKAGQQATAQPQPQPQPAPQPTPQPQPAPQPTPQPQPQAAAPFPAPEPTDDGNGGLPF